MRLAGRSAAQTRALALQRLEAAAQRRLGPRAIYPSHRRALSTADPNAYTTGQSADGPGRFLTPTPNAGAGLGHQLVTWCAGRVFADLLGVRFAHTPISEPWESHLRLAIGEVSAKDLRTTARTVRLPLIRSDASPPSEVDHTELARIAATYQDDEAILFRLALDQSRYDVTGAASTLNDKYWLGRQHQPPSAKLRVAVHIRRGDVAEMRATGERGWEQRWLHLGYFESLLASIDAVVGRDSREVVVVSEGDPSAFAPLARSFDAELVLGGDPTVAFDRLANADILVASPSGFSFIAGLVSPAVVLFPEPWWHALPRQPRWVPVSDDLSTVESVLRDRLAV